MGIVVVQAEGVTPVTKVGLMHEPVGGDEQVFRAVTVGKQATGRTPGEAIDALSSQLTDDESETLIVVRNMGPDRFFSASERERLERLMASWRAARDAGVSPPPEEQAELESLIDAEVRAAAERAEPIGRELGS
jgi:hypothetical protein